MSEPLVLRLATDDPAIEAAVRLATPGHRLTVVALDGLTEARGALGPRGAALLEPGADAVLVGWALDRAPVINALGFHLRARAAAPLIALCPGGPEEPVAALAAGADAALSFPLAIPAVRAAALAYRRLAAAWRPALDAASDAANGGDAANGADLASGPAEMGPLRLDRAAHRFLVRGEEVALTPREFALLAYLVGRAGEACTRAEILDAVWALDFDTGTNMVDVYAYYLRRKLEAYGLTGLIETVRGRGYRLVPPV